jgi:hypothetical protein
MLIERRKRRQQRRIWLSYAAAAMLLFAVGYFTYYEGTRNSLNINKNQVAADFKMDKQPRESNINLNDSINSNVAEHSIVSKLSERKRVKRSTKKHTPSIQSFSKDEFETNANPREKQLAGNATFRSYQKNIGMAGDVSLFMQDSIEMPALLQMHEEAKRARELRKLSVKLDDSDGYNNFWLTVNQQMLTNKFNGETALLHYDVPGTGDGFSHK